MARKMQLSKLHNPSLEQAREFFNWDINKHKIVGVDSTVAPLVLDGVTYYPGNMLEGFSEFRSSKGNTLHVTSSTYTPANPLIAFDKTTEAMEKMQLDYSVNGVGSFDNDSNIFAQFDVIANGKGGASRYGYHGSKFSINGKEYQGLITMAKGNDEQIPLSYWLTIICIVCANTFRAALRARKGNAQCVTMKQTKNSGERFDRIENEIAALFGVQDSVMETLQAMAEKAVTLTEAEKAFLGLVKPVTGEVDLSKTGKTRLQNTLDRYVAAFRSSLGVNGGNTREDWFNAVTNVDTHGNEASKNYDASKQFVSSEFGTYAVRKETAFATASNDEAWAEMVHNGEQLMAGLLSKPVVVADLGGDTFKALLNK
jgi:hypothetical protein